MDATTCRSAIATVAKALGWEVGKDFGQDHIMAVRHRGSVVVFKAPDGTTMADFIGHTEEERLQ